MNGLRNSVRGLRSLSTAAMAVVLCGGAMTIAAVTAVTNASPAAAFSATPAWFTTGGTAAPTLSCGTWYVTTMGAQTGGGNASITIYGGGGGGAGSSPYALGNTENTAVGGAGAKVIGTFTAAAGQSIATFIGCGGGGGGAHQSGSSGTGGAGGTGYASGANGGMFSSTEGESSGGGGGGGATTVCVYGSAGSPCATLLTVSGGGGGGGGAGCNGNGGNGGVGNAGATTGATASSETDATAPGGSANGQGFGGGGGGDDKQNQAGGGGGAGGVGAPGSSTSTTAKTGGGGAANSTGGAGGAKLSSGTGPAGTAGSAPASGVGAGAGGVGGTNGSGSEDNGGGGGGGGLAGGGGGAGNYCLITPELGSGGAGAGSSWVSTNYLTSFSSGSNPTFTAGSGTTTACGKQQTQGTTGASTGTGGSNNTSTSGTNAAYAGCPGGIALTWTALPGAPSGVTATGGTGQATVSWTAPADPGTSGITGYTVTATPTGAGSTVTQTFNSTATTETLTGLANGSSYNLSVAAVSTVGTGPSASASNNPVAIGVAPSITSGASTTFAEGSAGSFTVTTTGIPTPALSETGSLPSGVTFLDNGNGTATLSGTPNTGSNGVYPLTINATNGLSPAASQSFTLTVDGPPVITSAASTTFTEGSSGSFTVTTTGTPAPALSETGLLPSGVSFIDNGNGTATLAGTPITGSNGTYPITINATNGFSPDASQSFTLTVDGPPVITSDDSTTFTEGSSGSFTVTTTGTPAPALSETGSLPSGVTFLDNGDGTATLAGTPAAGSNGVYPLTINATNGLSPAASQSFTLTVDGPPVITSAASTTFTEGSSGSFTVTTTGTPAPALSETGQLPSGVSFVDNGNGTAALSGTPAVGTQGTYPITIGATNGFSPDASQSFTLTVDGPPAITSGDSTTFTEGSSGTFTVTSTGTPTAALSESGNLPSGVTFLDNGDGTATLAGTPAAGTSATYPITITASNGVSPDATQSFTLTVDGPPAITSGDSTTFTEGSSGTFTVTTSGLPDPALSESGNLPSGVTFTDNGDGTAALAGTPDTGTQGTYPITITASNGFSPDASQSFTLTVDGPPTITSGDSTTFTEGSSGNFTVASTGTPTAALSESGSLPSGVTFNDNGDGTATLAGTPAAGSNGIYPITITASNGVSPDASQSFTLTVDGPPTITSGDSTTFTEGSSGTFTVTTTGTPAPALSESGSLPSGVTFLDNGDGTATLAGTPAAGSNGIYPITITASNGVSPDASQSFTLTVTGPPTITSGHSTTFTEGSVEDFTVTSTGTPAPSLTEHGRLPAGITFTDNGDGTADLAGTPATGSNGVYTLTIDAANGIAPRATQTFTLTVNAAPVFISADSTTFDQSSSGSFEVTTTGDPTPSLIEFGTLPSGVTFRDNGNGTGTLAGATSQRGTFQFYFGADNGVGPEVAQEFTLTVGGLEITTTSLPTLTLGIPYSVQLTATGGIPPISWGRVGKLPKGLRISRSGVLSGTVLAKKVGPGTYSIEVKATDSTKRTHQTKTATFSLQIQS